MITNHGFGRVFEFAVFSKLIQLAQTIRWQICLSLLKRFVNKLVLFICIESLLVSSILFGTGYIAVFN